VVALATFMARPAGPVAEPQSGSALRLAILPCTNIETTFRKFHPLLNYLKSTTSHTVTLAVPADLAQLETDAANGRIDFVLQDPHTFQQVSRLFDTAVLLQARSLDGTLKQSGVLVVRRDSGVTDLVQLRGKTVMFGPRISSPKWVAARSLFESKGIDVDRDLKVINGGCCEDIAFAVIVGSVEAGVICDHFLGHHGARQKELGVDADALEVLGRTPTVPTRILAARKGVPADVIEAISGALLALDQEKADHAAILISAEMRGFVKTTEGDYLKGVTTPAPAAGR
jgi:phosphonate transport system substrate-binding protein